MKRFIWVLGGIILSTLSHGVRAQTPWYLSASAGAYLREDQGGPTTFTNGVTTGPGIQHETFEPGPVVSLALGRNVLERLRIEGEMTYAHYYPNHVNPLSQSFPQLNGGAFNRQSGGDLNRFIGTINAFFDIPVDFEEGRYRPYLGGGFGYAHSQQALARFSNGVATFNQAGPESDHAVILAEGGVTIAVSDSWSLVPAYRYLHYLFSPNRFGDESAHIVKLGLRYTFRS